MGEETENKEMRFPTFSTGDAMGAFGISRRKVEFYVQLGLTDPTLPKVGRGRGYSYYDLLRLGVAVRLEKVNGVAPRNLWIYLRWLDDGWLASDKPLKFSVIDDEMRRVDVPNAEEVVAVLQGPETTAVDLTRIKKTLNNYLEVKYDQQQ